LLGAGLTGDEEQRNFVRMQFHLSGHVLSIKMRIPPTLLLELRINALVTGSDKWNPEIALRVSSSLGGNDRGTTRSDGRSSLTASS